MNETPKNRGNSSKNPLAPLPQIREKNGKDPKTGRFLPGNCANPGGRPKTALISQALREALEEVAESGDKTTAQELASVLIKHAKTGRPGTSVVAIGEICDRSEGKAQQSIRVEQTLDAETVTRLMNICELLNGGKTLEGEFTHPADCGCLDCQKVRSDEAQAKRDARLSQCKTLSASAGLE